MKEELNKNSWNDRYLNNDIPWEDGEYSPEMVQLFHHFIEKGNKVLEIGCGIGTNGVYLASEGYNYTGLDISEEAVRLAKKRFKEENLNGNFIVRDMLKNPPTEKFYAIFDKGCLHSFKDKKDRENFISMVHSTLEPGGFWINISGNRDNPDRLGTVEKYGFPRLKASDIVIAAEDKFQIQYIARCIYGNSEKYTRFLGWACALQKR